ncbi:amidohydrolase family protein [Sphingomonas oligophenolica]|uniref:Amidohydrolase family protein n=1 Tax=Sphingomonas oligophenolica TaxID=301154 RepID=A0ABU9Y961_9SPHN
MGATGAAVAMGGSSALLAAGPGSAPASKIVDVHYHIYPPQVLAGANSLAEQVRSLAGVRDWDAARAVDILESEGVETAVISFANPVFWADDTASQRRLARLCNDYFAKVRSDHAGRFGVLAALPPLTDVDGALAEISYSLDQLKVDGVRVMTSYAGKAWLGDSAFAPVWDELNRRRAIVFVHPDLACSCIKAPSMSLELPFDTARAAFSLWRNGAFDRWPNIRFILSHGGGPVPMLVARFNGTGRPGADGTVLRDAEVQLRKAWFDTAQAASRVPLTALLALADPTRILFGSDKPFGPPAAQARALAAAIDDRRLLAAIEAGNALRLLTAAG